MKRLTLAALFLYVLNNVRAADLAAALDLSVMLKNAAALPYNPGFDIAFVTKVAQELPSHSWEYGTCMEALLELYNPDASVFGATPFPVVNQTAAAITSLAYAETTIVMGSGANGLSHGSGAVGDPASTGVAAVMLGKADSSYEKAATAQLTYMLYDAPRFWNGAISQRANTPELWADFMYMAPPFIAFYAADKNNATLLYEAVNQCALYRQILQSNSTDSRYQGLWQHIIGTESTDKGLWSTGNSWAAAGMSRVLATVIKAPVAQNATWQADAISNLNTWIKEILDGAMRCTLDDGLLRNYLDDTTGPNGFGEISGSSMLANVAYRMAVISPDQFGSSYVQWADQIRSTLGSNDSSGNPHITSQGIATPAVNPLAWHDTKPFTTGSPEGQSFVVLMYSAWRDCITAGICTADDTTAPQKRSHRSRGHAGFRTHHV
ncbi:Six-hairpin glycosidase-like protein [Mycena floridula]|nr:Six-hairpin glycosidase-like protein [Mycena floridula]